MMYLPKLFAHAAVVFLMFLKMTFTSLLLPTLVIILTYFLYALALSKSKEKHSMGKVYRL